MKPISNEIREKIVIRCQGNEFYTTIADCFGICTKTVERIYGQFRKTGSIEPKAYPGSKRKILADDEQRLKEAIAAKPGITTGELIEQLSLPVGQSTLSRHLKTMGQTFKKKRSSPRHSNAPMCKRGGAGGGKS